MQDCRAVGGQREEEDSGQSGRGGFRRQLEGRNPESLAYAFSGTLPQSASVLIFMPQSPLARMRIGTVPGPPGDLKDAPRFVAGTASESFLGQAADPLLITTRTRTQSRCPREWVSPETSYTRE